MLPVDWIRNVSAGDQYHALTVEPRVVNVINYFSYNLLMSLTLLLACLSNFHFFG